MKKPTFLVLLVAAARLASAQPVPSPSPEPSPSTCMDARCQIKARELDVLTKPETFETIAPKYFLDLCDHQAINGARLAQKPITVMDYSTQDSCSRIPGGPDTKYGRSIRGRLPTIPYVVDLDKQIVEDINIHLASIYGRLDALPRAPVDDATFRDNVSKMIVRDPRFVQALARAIVEKGSAEAPPLGPEVEKALVDRVVKLELRIQQLEKDRAKP